MGAKLIAQPSTLWATRPRSDSRMSLIERSRSPSELQRAALFCLEMNGPCRRTWLNNMSRNCWPGTVAQRVVLAVERDWLRHKASRSGWRGPSLGVVSESTGSETDVKRQRLAPRERTLRSSSAQRGIP